METTAVGVKIVLPNNGREGFPRQLRRAGADGRATGRRGGRGRARRPGLQAAQPVAHVLERGRRAVPDPRNHLAGRLRALLRRARGHGRRDPGGPGGPGAAQRALRPPDAARDSSGTPGAFRPAHWRAALRRLDAVNRWRPTARCWPAFAPSALIRFAVDCHRGSLIIAAALLPLAGFE